MGQISDLLLNGLLNNSYQDSLQFDIMVWFQVNCRNDGSNYTRVTVTILSLEMNVENEVFLAILQFFYFFLII